MKLKIFLLTLMVVIFTGCGNSQPVGDAEQAPNQLPIAEANASDDTLFNGSVEPDEVLADDCSELKYEHPDAKASDRIACDVNIKVDMIVIDGMSVLSLVFATDEVLSKYDAYTEFVDPDIDEQFAALLYNADLRYAFLASVALHDFQWIDVGHMTEMVSEFHLVDIFYQRSILHSVGDLLPGVPFVVTTMNDAKPRRGISFVDNYGIRRYFAITRNETDAIELEGAFVILEFDN